MDNNDYSNDVESMELFPKAEEPVSQPVEVNPPIPMSGSGDSCGEASGIDQASEMQPTALVFLDDPLARRLAVAWVSCKGDDKMWLEAAGMERNLMADAHRLCAALKLNGICLPGGVTHQLAIRYITTFVAAQLTKGQKR